jgi:hypothetical protein
VTTASSSALGRRLCIFGRFALGDNLKGIVGFGYQFAVTPTPIVPDPLTLTYNHAWLTSRIAF